MLRLALALLAAEEAKWADLLGRSGMADHLGREVRHKSLQVAQRRVLDPVGRYVSFGLRKVF
jgi:hypothetical protein